MNAIGKLNGKMMNITTGFKLSIGVIALTIMLALTHLGNPPAMPG